MAYVFDLEKSAKALRLNRFLHSLTRQETRELFLRDAEAATKGLTGEEREMVKRLDWKVFGRSDRFYIREFDEETNLRASVLLDASGSMAYRGTKGFVKFEHARKLAAALAYVLTGQQDAVGLVTFDSKVREFIPSRTKTTHLHNILETLLRTHPGADTSLAGVLQNLAPRLRRRGLLLLITDGFDDADALLQA